MMWKKWLLPLVCLGMCLLNTGQLVARLSQPGQDALMGQGLMSLFWLGLAVLSFRGYAGKKKDKKDDEG